MKLLLKILKGVMYLASAVLFVFFVINFIGGIYNACVADDIITAQDRIQGSYSFMRMVLFIFLSVTILFLTLLIKEKIFPLKEKAETEETEEAPTEEEPVEESSNEEPSNEDAPLEEEPQEEKESGE